VVEWFKAELEQLGLGEETTRSSRAILTVTADHTTFM
jgi:hypothetical protein